MMASPRGIAGIAFALILGACAKADSPSAKNAAAQQGVSVPVPEGVRPTPALPARFRSIGRAATSAEIRAWNIDANPTGAGLPPGRGTHAAGAKLFATQCAVCHGPKGEGMATFPRLIGAEPRDFSFARDPKLVKTIGNYWPYATTLYDYINRAMPFTAPGTLKPDDVYSLVAYLLAENGVIDTALVIDRESLPKVKMPARGHFVLDNRTGGATFR